MVIRYLDDLKATPSCHFVKNKVILNFIAHTQASNVIMKFNILRFGIFFALIGIIFYTFIPNAESSPFSRNRGGGESRGEGSNYELHSSSSGSSYNRIQQRNKRDNNNPYTNGLNTEASNPKEIMGISTWGWVFIIGGMFVVGGVIGIVVVCVFFKFGCC